MDVVLLRFTIDILLSWVAGTGVVCRRWILLMLAIILSLRDPMKVPRLYYASAVVGHRIFVGGGREEESVEYLEFAKTCGENKKTKAKKDDKVISFSSTWRTHSDMVISDTRASSCAVVAMGSCLVVAGRTRRTVEVLDTNRNLLWNVPSLENGLYGCSIW